MQTINSCNHYSSINCRVDNLPKVSTDTRATFRHAAVSIFKNLLCPIIKYTIGLIRLASQKIWDGTNVRDSDVLLVLFAKRDGNGALYVPHPIMQLKVHTHKTMKVIYKEVSSIAEINDVVKKIKDQNNRIKNLLINAHGNSGGMRLDEEEYLHSDNLEKLQPSLDGLEKGASIILLSCKTGYIGSYGMANIAQSIASIAPHTKVYAPLHSIAAINFDVYWQDDTLGAKYSIPQKSERAGLLGNILNIAYFAGFYLSIGTLFKQSDTGVFKHFDKTQFV